MSPQRRSLRGGLPTLALVLALAACARSADEVRADFESYVAGANHCTTASECTAVSPGCPLGCSTAVRADRARDVERKARELISEYERAGAACVYDCAGPRPLTCIDRRCAFAPAEVSRQPTPVTFRVQNPGSEPAFLGSDCQNYALTLESDGPSRPIAAELFCPTCRCSEAPCGPLPTCGACLPSLGSTIAAGQTAAVTWNGLDHATDAARACTRDDVAPVGRYRFAVETFASAEDAAARRKPRTSYVEFELPDADGVVTLTVPGL